MIEARDTRGPIEFVAWRRAAAAGLRFRAMREDDLPFLCRVYGSTRADELAQLDWSAEQKAAFVDMQFRAQHDHYQLHHAAMDWLVILRGENPVGRLYLERKIDEHGIVDISLLAEYRGQGFGTALLEALLLDVASDPQVVTLTASVHEGNTASMRAFARVGFHPAGADGDFRLFRREVVAER